MGPADPKKQDWVKNGQFGLFKSLSIDVYSMTRYWNILDVWGMTSSHFLALGEECLASMADYVIRSSGRSPVWMRTDGDACIFATIVAEVCLIRVFFCAAVNCLIQSPKKFSCWPSVFF